jgi:hypothetical protein
MTATIPDYTRAIYKNLKKFRGEATLFHLDPPIKGEEWVVESDAGFEVLVFASDKYGKVKSFLDIANRPLEELGYEIK